MASSFGASIPSSTALATFNQNGETKEPVLGTHDGVATKVKTSTFPNWGVSLAFLCSMRDGHEMKQSMLSLVRPDLDKDKLRAMPIEEIRKLAEELRVHSDLDGDIEFGNKNKNISGKYENKNISREAWVQKLMMPPRTTTQVNVCIIKPRTKKLGGSYATTVLCGKNDSITGLPYARQCPTDFVSHAWRCDFAELVNALEEEHTNRILQLPYKQAVQERSVTRYYWNDIFVKDQNTSDKKPDGYFFNAFRTAVQTIGRTVLVLEQLRGSVALTRAWCIWEIFCTAEKNIDLVVTMPTQLHT